MVLQLLLETGSVSPWFSAHALTVNVPVLVGVTTIAALVDLPWRNVPGSQVGSSGLISKWLLIIGQMKSVPLAVPRATVNVIPKLAEVVVLWFFTVKLKASF